MASDDTLRIITQVELTGIQTGMQESAAAVEAGTAQMKADFEELREVSGHSITEARHALHGFGEEIGIHVPRFVQSFVAQLGGVGPALAMAFTPIAIVGVGEVLVEAGKKLVEFYENVVNLKAAFEAIEQTERKFTEDQLTLSNALVAGQVHLAGLAGGPVVEAKARLSSLGDEIVDLGKMLDKSGKSFEDLGVAARSSIREFLAPTQAKDLAETLKNVGLEIGRVQHLLRNTEEGTTEYKELQGAVQLLSSFYDTLALKVQKYNQEGAIGAVEVQKAIEGEAEKKARAEEQAANRAQRAWHQKVIAELDDAERLAKEKTRILTEEAKANEQFYKTIEAEEKTLDKKIEEAKNEALHQAIEANNKELKEREKLLHKEVEEENKAFNRITSDINKNLISAINGQESFGRAAQKVWTGLVDDALSSILKIGEKWATQHLLMAGISKLFHVQDAAGELAAITVKIAAMKTLGMADVGLAGSGGVASMAAAPFPIDTTAPAFGASMSAAAASFLAFESGGIVPGFGPVPAIGHGGEMILNEDQQRAIGGGGNHTFNFNHHGGGSSEQVRNSSREFFKMAKREMRRMNR